MGVCRPCSMPMFSARLGAAATARRLVVAVVGCHALVGDGGGVCWVRRIDRLRVGSMAVEGWWGGVGVSWCLIAAGVRSVLGRVVRGVGRIGPNRRGRNV
jgi:hypothetical protein